MGRLGSDVLALVCIAGGALAAAGITAGVLASSADGDVQVMTMTQRCMTMQAPRVVVRLGSGEGTASVTTHARAPRATSCANIEATSVSVIRTTEWTEELGEQLDAARVQMEGMRIDADEIRFRADELGAAADEAMLRVLEEQLAELESTERSFEAQELARVLESVARIEARRPAEAPPAPTPPGGGN